MRIERFFYIKTKCCLKQSWLYKLKAEIDSIHNTVDDIEAPKEHMEANEDDIEANGEDIEATEMDMEATEDENLYLVAKDMEDIMKGEREEMIREAIIPVKFGMLAQFPE